MKYFNLVFIKHPNEARRSYLYELPLNADINAGEKLCVCDRRGEHVGVATSPNFYASESLTKTLCVCCGGYFPPAKVIGTVSTITVTQDVVNKYEAEPKDTAEEEFPWF